MDNVEGRVIIITGAGAGIGKATALAFSRKGANVVLADIDPDSGNQLAEEIGQEGGKAIFVKADVSDTGEVKAMIDKAVKVYGKLDYAFNNAGIAIEFAPVHEASEEAWDQVIAVNLKGVWACMKYEIAYMLKNGGGTIVNMSSIHGFTGMQYHYAYVASKHGVIGLTRCAALDYGKQGIRINALCPGLIETPLVKENREVMRADEKLWEIYKGLEDEHKIGRLGKPEEVAEAVVFLCTAPMFLSGTNLVIDGAAMCH